MIVWALVYKYLGWLISGKAQKRFDKASTLSLGATAMILALVVF